VLVPTPVPRLVAQGLTNREIAQLERVPSRRMATHSTTAAEGSEAPRFELPDAQGIAHSLDSLLTRGPVVLVFLRGFA
jgi:hypothetical protein